MTGKVAEAGSQHSIPWVVAALGVGLFSGSMGIYMVPVQVGALMDGLQLSESRTGLLGMVEVASMSLTAITISTRLATWSRCRTAVYGILLAALCEFITAFVSTTMLLFPLRVFVGIGCGLVFASVCAAAASTTEPDRFFGWAQAVMNALFFFMFLLIPYSLGYAMHRGLFLSLGLVLLATLPLYRFLLDSRVSEAYVDTTGARASTLLIATHVLATILLNIGLGALWGFVERIGTHNVGLGPETIGRVLSMATLFMIGGSLFAAWLGTRIGRAIPMVVASLLCALAAMFVTNAESLTVYALGLFLYNFAYLFLGPYIIAGTAAALDPSGRLAAAMGGVMFLSYSVGIGTGGFIAELISLGGIGIMALFTCLLAAPLFAFVSVQLDRRESGKVAS